MSHTTLDSHHSSLSIAISTLLTSFLLKKFQLDQTLFYGPLYTLLSVLCTELEWSTWIEYFKTQDQSLITLAYILLAAIILRMIWNRFLSFSLLKKKDNHGIITIYDNETLIVLTKYFKLVNTSKNLSLNVGDLELCMNASFSKTILSTIGKSITTKDNYPVSFVDKELGISGTFTWKKSSFEKEASKDDPKTTIYIKYCEIKLDSSVDTRKFLRDIESKVNLPDIVELTFYKVLNNTDEKTKKEIPICNHTSTFYIGPHLSSAIREAQFMKPFFHKEKDRIWNLLKMIDNEADKFNSIGQSAVGNFLLYGPHGSGKSSFAYRIARSLPNPRHIVSLDLRTFKDKQSIYQVLQRPGVKSLRPNEPTYKSVVFVLEELDLSIRELLRRENENQQTHSPPNHLYKNSGEGTQPLLLNTHEAKHDFSLHDLLELLQGTVPLEGSIIIATTNHFEFIKTTCPALIRVGRLTPIEFGYLEAKEIQELTRYFFGKDINFKLPKKIPILQTSLILEWVKEYKLVRDNDWKGFCAEMKNYFEQNAKTV